MWLLLLLIILIFAFSWTPWSAPVSSAVPNQAYRLLQIVLFVLIIFWLLSLLGFVTVGPFYTPRGLR